jgi:membrane peptidoglycan carboxypeptidase
LSLSNPDVTEIQSVYDSKGKVLEETKPKSFSVLDPEVARKISSILSDNVARTPLYGANSALYFGDRQVAVKTGTTNDYKDAWIIGYTPNIVVGTWAGNNNNTPMEKKVAGLIVAPMWRAFMQEVLAKTENRSFNNPLYEDSYDLKPVLRGKWQGTQREVATPCAQAWIHDIRIRCVSRPRRKKRSACRVEDRRGRLYDCRSTVDSSGVSFGSW